MNVLWITWKSSGHPEAGGAEVVCSELCKRMVADGHQVTLLTSEPTVVDHEKQIDGVTVVRIGKRRSLHPSLALLHYIRHMRGRYDVVIEEINGGAPYFAVFFGRKSRRFLLYHQLARRNWQYEFGPPISWLGYYVLVPIATWIMSLSKTPVITVSESTRAELTKFGFPSERTGIISEGIHIEPLESLKRVKKYDKPTVLSHGSMRAMKRTIDQIKAFELAKKQIPDLQMKISGSSGSPYGQKVMAYIAASPYAKDITYLGRTTDAEKVELMRRSHVILVTSVEEGWGLIVSEANSQGTPAVVYDVNGLRDSVRSGVTGVVTDTVPHALANGVVRLLQNKEAYQTIRKQAWVWSRGLTFDRSYQDFKELVGL